MLLVLLAAALGTLLLAQGADTSTYVRVRRCGEAKDSPARGSAITAPLPIYPRELGRAGIGGEVFLRVKVGKDGRASDITVVEATMKEFADAAIAAVKQWKFVEVVLPKKEPAGLIMECLITFTIADE